MLWRWRAPDGAHRPGGKDVPAPDASVFADPATVERALRLLVEAVGQSVSTDEPVGISIDHGPQWTELRIGGALDRAAIRTIFVQPASRIDRELRTVVDLLAAQRCALFVEPDGKNGAALVLRLPSAAQVL
jgi:hypothetical protein